MNPTELMNRTLLECSKVSGVILWRQNVGLAYPVNQVEKIVAGERGRPIMFGVPGMADLGGIAAPDGVTVGIECKAGSGRQSDQQKKYQAMLEKHGGIYIIARDPDKARQDLDRALATRRRLAA